MAVTYAAVGALPAISHIKAVCGYWFVVVDGSGLTKGVGRSLIIRSLTADPASRRGGEIGRAQKWVFERS